MASSLTIGLAGVSMAEIILEELFRRCELLSWLNRKIIEARTKEHDAHGITKFFHDGQQGELKHRVGDVARIADLGAATTSLASGVTLSVLSLSLVGVLALASGVHWGFGAVAFGLALGGAGLLISLLVSVARDRLREFPAGEEPATFVGRAWKRVTAWDTPNPYALAAASINTYAIILSLYLD